MAKCAELNSISTRAAPSEHPFLVFVIILADDTRPKGSRSFTIWEAVVNLFRLLMNRRMINDLTSYRIDQV
jgi:hypothetical protein